MAIIGNIERPLGKGKRKIEIGTKELLHGGTFETEMGNPEIVLCGCLEADHSAWVRSVVGRVVTVNVLDLTTPGTPAWQTTTAQTINYIAIGY